VKTIQEKRRQATEEFDPYLPVAIADTWYALGLRVNPIVRAQTDSERLRLAKAWAEILNRGLARDRYKPESVLEFAITLNNLLERKFDREPIAAEVRRLIERRGACSVEDRDDHHLIVLEDEREFWSLEYRSLFMCLKFTGPEDWRNAVNRCSNVKCRRFFIKQRGDHIFCSDKCRMAQRNREAYASIHTRSHKG
jgi:hypothetical protein